nr:YadA-like family protein [Burkholderia anthina]
MSVGAAVPNLDGAKFNRQIVNVADGTETNDAVNYGQLQTTNAAVAATNTALSTTNTQLAGLAGDMTTVKNDVAGHTTEITTINNQLAGLSDGTIGLVQQAKAGDDLTVGAATDGAAVNFSGTAGDRKLSGIADGTMDSDAVNYGQLKTTNATVANLDNRVTVNEGAITNLDGRVTTNETSIAKLADQIGNGELGLVRQAKAGDDLTVGAATDGAAVNFSGATGDRKLSGIADGTMDSDAVNYGQLNTGLSTTNAAIANVDNRVTNLDGRVTTNEGDITTINNALSKLSSGAVGLVQQAGAADEIKVGAATGGTSVNFAGAGGNRMLSGVAPGVNDSDAVTIAQLRATGLIDYTGKEIGAVTYDDLSLDAVTFGGTNGSKLQMVAAGAVNATSMDAINGSQLYALQEQFASQYGDLSSRFGDLSGRVGDLEAAGSGGGSGGGIGGPGTGGPGSIVVGDGSAASGSNGSAIGQGSVATGENGTAVGQGSAASGSNGTAIGQGSNASGDNSMAIGQGSSATGTGSVAIGQGSVATEANTVSFGNGTAEGNRRLVNIADGINASDAATKGQLDRAMESVDQRFNDTNRAINDVAKNAYAGIAAAMAMPNMTPSQPGKTVVAVGAANFKSGSAIAAGATYRSRNGNWLVNGATSVTSVGDVGVRAQVGYEF